VTECDSKVLVSLPVVFHTVFKREIEDEKQQRCRIYFGISEAFKHKRVSRLSLVAKARKKGATRRVSWESMPNWFLEPPFANNVSVSMARAPDSTKVGNSEVNAEGVNAHGIVLKLLSKT
jgi:hypothetical protein